MRTGLVVPSGYLGPNAKFGSLHLQVAAGHRLGKELLRGTLRWMNLSSAGHFSRRSEQRRAHSFPDPSGSHPVCSAMQWGASCRRNHRSRPRKTTHRGSAFPKALLVSMGVWGALLGVLLAPQELCRSSLPAWDGD